MKPLKFILLITVFTCHSLAIFSNELEQGDEESKAEIVAIFLSKTPSQQITDCVQVPYNLFKIRNSMDQLKFLRTEIEERYKKIDHLNREGRLNYQNIPDLLQFYVSAEFRKNKLKTNFIT